MLPQIRHLCQLKLAIFLNSCLIRSVPLKTSRLSGETNWRSFLKFFFCLEIREAEGRKQRHDFLLPSFTFLLPLLPWRTFSLSHSRASLLSHFLACFNILSHLINTNFINTHSHFLTNSHSAD
jgi:hypothetical protein